MYGVRVGMEGMMISSRMGSGSRRRSSWGAAEKKAKIFDATTNLHDM